MNMCIATCIAFQTSLSAHTHTLPVPEHAFLSIILTNNKNEITILIVYHNEVSALLKKVFSALTGDYYLSKDLN